MKRKAKQIQPLDKFCKTTLFAAMRSAYDELLNFAGRPEFQILLDELYSLPPHLRPSFVNEVIMDAEKMAERGLAPPDGILIQRSSFGDRRPTLFCIKKYIDERLQTHWQNVNLTFDNIYEGPEVPRGSDAWRRPLPFGVQQALVANLITAEEIDAAIVKARDWDRQLNFKSTDPGDSAGQS